MFKTITWGIREYNAELHFKKGNYLKALEMNEQAWKHSKSKTMPYKYYERKGIALYHLHRYGEAIEALEKVEGELLPLLKNKKVGEAAFSELQRPAWYLTKAINRKNAAQNT